MASRSVAPAGGPTRVTTATMRFDYGLSTEAMLLAGSRARIEAKSRMRAAGSRIELRRRADDQAEHRFCPLRTIRAFPQQ